MGSTTDDFRPTQSVGDLKHARLLTGLIALGLALLALTIWLPNRAPTMENVLKSAASSSWPSPLRDQVHTTLQVVAVLFGIGGLQLIVTARVSPRDVERERAAWLRGGSLSAMILFGALTAVCAYGTYASLAANMKPIAYVAAALGGVSALLAWSEYASRRKAARRNLSSDSDK